MNKCILLLLVSCILAIQCAHAGAQFSFSLPGNWGNGKRGFNFALPGKWGNVKRDGGKVDCSGIDGSTVLTIYKAIHEEAARLSYCVAEMKGESEKH